MSDPDQPDMDLNIVVPFFDALFEKDRTDKYADPTNLNLKFGFYYAYDIINAQIAAVTKGSSSLTDRTQAKTAVKVKIPVPGSSQKFAIPMKYVLRYADVAMKSSPAADGTWDLDVDDYLQRREKADQARNLHLTVTRRMGDVVHDDAKELALCNFPWGEALEKQSVSGRRDFERNLKDIAFVPTEMADADSMIAAKDAPTTKRTGAPSAWNSRRRSRRRVHTTCKATTSTSGRRKA